MTDTMTIRSATVADYGVFAMLFLELGVDDPVMSVENFAAEMVKTTVIAERDGKVAGYAFFRPMVESSHLSHIVSAPHARRTGVGRALMSEVIARSKAAGCATLTLNVLPANAKAIALYESFGLERVFVSRGLRIDWTVVDALSEDATPYLSEVREIDPGDDDRIERATKLAKGMLADQRARPGRVVRAIETDPANIALAIFDTSFPGVYPLRAPDAPQALSLLRALRPHARAGDVVLNIMIEDHVALADALIALGARLRLETLSMRGSI